MEYKLIFRANTEHGLSLLLLGDKDILLKFYVKDLDELNIVKQMCMDTTCTILNTKHNRYGELCKFIIQNKITNINIEELFETIYV